ncbi:hypothetical protein FQN60_012780, partial [Etheostoma spectabile]
ECRLWESTTLTDGDIKYTLKSNYSHKERVNSCVKYTSPWRVSLTEPASTVNGSDR